MRKIGIECESIEGNQTWGVGRQVKKLLQEIANHPELSDQFKFFLYFKTTIPEYSFLNSPLFAKKIVSRFSRKSFSLYYYIFLPIRLYLEKLDLVYFPNYMLPLFIRGKSLVMLTEDVFREIRATDLPWRYRLAYKIFATRAAKKATRIMAISMASKQILVESLKIAPEKIAVNPLGVDLKINPITKSFLPATDYLLYVGQAFPRRHLWETMLAFEKIAPARPNLKLMAIGKDKYRPPLVEKQKNEINARLGREAIIHYDYVSDKDLANFYRQARGLIYVSETEAFGLPPLEALSYHTIPIVADTAVSHEIFGDNAFFVQLPISSSSIATTLQEAIENKTKSAAILANADSILHRFTWQKHADNFINIVKLMMN